MILYRGACSLQNDIVLVGELREELNVKLELWKQVLKIYGFRISRSKTKYTECKFTKRHTNSNLGVKIGDDSIPQITRFKYLRSIIKNDREIEGNVNHRIQVGWSKWRSTFFFDNLQTTRPLERREPQNKHRNRATIK